jgi:hypothetical protein
MPSTMPLALRPGASCANNAARRSSPNISSCASIASVMPSVNSSRQSPGTISTVRDS